MKSRQYSHSQCVLAFCVLIAGAQGCTPARTVSPIVTSATVQTSSGVQVYFTDPSAPGAKDYYGGPDRDLAAAIDSAQYSVDVAAYSLNLWSIRDALIHACRRGVVVRVVMESDNMDNLEIQDLVDAGISLLGDRHEGLMHDKFIVIDRDEVWTGSMNYTVGSTYRDYNNLVRIRSIPIAELYTQELERMFKDDLFGPDKGSIVPSPALTLGDTRMETYFSPENGVAGRIVELVGSTRESIRFMAYSFTSDVISEAVINAARSGVGVHGVMDGGQILSNMGGEYDKLLQAGLDVRRFDREGLMHNKVIILDEQIVITGSYNFSMSAEKTNDENVVIIFDPIIASQFLQEFQKIYDLAGP